GKLLQRAQPGVDPLPRERLAVALSVGLNQLLCGVSLYDRAAELADVPLPPALRTALTGRSRRHGAQAVRFNRQIVEAAYAGRL
ncbi:MAG: hypothetical protein HYU66_01720, partial [Armatimonadetes bacterium]|nr:hypothetical protein [Armatimonadota bacterium]